MAITERQPGLAQPSHDNSVLTGNIVQERILRTYEYPHLGLRVEVVSPDDGRVPSAIDIEVDSMSRLGDLPEEVREEFQPYRNYSAYYLVYAIDGNTLLGMGRIIPSTESGDTPADPADWDNSKRPYGNKSLLDLAKIHGWSLPNLAEQQQYGEIKVYTHNPYELAELYKDFYECETLDKVKDITILAPDPNLNDKLLNSQVGAALMTAFTTDMLRDWANGEITHLISFNEVDAHAAFVRHGFPFEPLFGLPPMQYDSFHSSTGMLAQISGINIDTLAQVVLGGRTRMLGSIAMQPEVKAILS